MDAENAKVVYIIGDFADHDGSERVRVAGAGDGPSGLLARRLHCDSWIWKIERAGPMDSLWPEMSLTLRRA